MYSYPPLGVAWWGFDNPLGYVAAANPKHGARIQENIPEGTVALENGAQVLCEKGEHVGNAVSDRKSSAFRACLQMRDNGHFALIPNASPVASLMEQGESPSP